jgi:arylsulfatase A-like enzyme
MVWMSPAVAVAASLVVGVLLRGTVRVFRIEYPMRLYWFVFSALAAYMLLRTARLGVRVDAAWLLAVGVAVQAARVASSRWRSAQVMVRRSLPWLTAVVVLLGMGLHGARYVTERRALALLPAVDGRLPNVLLIILDTVRAQNLSLYGYGRPTTPELRALARDGVVFDRAVATAPWTLPSHASLFTGRFAHEVTADWGTPLDDTYPTIAEALGTRGYETVGVVANLLYTTRRSGLQRGFASYHDHPVSPFMMLQNSWVGRLILSRLEGFTTSFEALVGKTAETVNQQFMGWLGRRNGDRPFFAFLNYFDAHGPYRPPAPFDTLFTATLPDGRTQPGSRQGARDFERVTAAYDGGLAYVDAQLGRLLRQMQAMGKLENTIVIVTSDHGEHLGERENQMVGHGNSLYVQLLHVPLVIVYPPSVPAGLRLARPADIRDIPATVMDLVGLGGDSEFPGLSLSRHWTRPAGSDATGGEPILSELSAKVGEPPSRAAQALTAGVFQYIIYGDGSEELYNLESDPAGELDLAAAPETREDLTRLRASLDSLLSASTAGSEYVNPRR